MCLILIGGGIIGTLLLWLVFCIPTDNAYARYCANGREMIGSREWWHRYLVDYDASTLDNVTEMEMLKVASTPFPEETGESTLQYAMRAYRILDQPWYEGNKDWDFPYESYERYWHGYTVILKPVLHYFSYTDIIFMNMAIQIALIFVLLYVLIKKNYTKLQFIFVFFWILTMQVIIMFSMDYSVCFYEGVFG